VRSRLFGTFPKWTLAGKSPQALENKNPNFKSPISLTTKQEKNYSASNETDDKVPKTHDFPLFSSNPTVSGP
jgi:hypothetical protein